MDETGHSLKDKRVRLLVAMHVLSGAFRLLLDLGGFSFCQRVGEQRGWCHPSLLDGSRTPGRGTEIHLIKKILTFCFYSKRDTCPG